MFLRSSFFPSVYGSQSLSPIRWGCPHTGCIFLSYSSRQIPNLREDPESSQADKLSHYFNPLKEVKAEQMCTDLIGGG